jgi:tetratricopeptide (TPR) repeat protein
MKLPSSGPALALAALVLAAGATTARAQFQFLTDGPKTMRDETRRSPAEREPAPVDPREKKGFFGRLFSREEEPPRNRGYYEDTRTPVPPPAYAPAPAYAAPSGTTTYVRDGVRFSDPPRGFSPAVAPAPAATPYAAPTGEPQWVPVQSGFGASPTRAFDGRPSGTSIAPNNTVRPLNNQGYPEDVRYRTPVQPNYPAVGAEPINVRTAPAGGVVRDAFGGQGQGGQTYYPAPAPQYAPAQVPAAAEPRYPAPARQQSSLDRPGFFSRLFGRSNAAPATDPNNRYTVREGIRYAPGTQPGAYEERPLAQPAYPQSYQPPAPAAWSTPNTVLQPAAPPDYQPAAAPPTSPGFAPVAPLGTQDPFSGQRPSRRFQPPPEPAQPIPQIPERQPVPTNFGTPRSSLEVVPTFPSVAPPENLSPAEQRIFQAGVKPEDQRYLMYLYAKTGRAEMAEPLAQGILARDPTNQEALLAMSAAFVERKRPDKALAYASELYRAYPDSKDALYYYGAASHLAGNYQEAAAILRHLRLEKFAGKPFPYQLDLAAAAEKSGDWRGQMTAYQELLDQNTADDHTRVIVRRVLEPLQREHSDHLSAQATSYHLDSGQLWQERAAGRTQLDGRNQLHAEALREDVLISASPLLRRRWTDDTEGQIGLQTTWSQRWLTDFWAGGSQAGALGGARLMHRLPSNGSVWIEAYASERARDGLLLHSLDGRQHRLTLAGNYLLAERFQTYGALTGREVLIGDERLAVGLQGNWGVEFLARRETPEFKLGYRGAYHANTRKSGNLALVAPAVLPTATIAQQTQVLDSAVLHWLHREGVYADLRDRLWGPLFYHLFGGVDYAFERSSMEFTGRVGLSYQPRKSLEFGTEVAYTTSAATTDGASGLWEIGLSAKWWF